MASRRVAIAWLALSSLCFYVAPYVLYGSNGPAPILLLIFSIIFNYLVGRSIIILSGRPVSFIATAIGIVADLGVLAYFKYSGFAVSNFGALFGEAIPWQVILPIGISFYTFTQIAFLIDASRGKIKHLGFTEYALFVTWFPHLIAGPILHHSEMIGQFNRAKVSLIQPRNIAVGLAIFSTGLAKKILIADNLAPYADAVFASPDHVLQSEAWLGALAYTLQLYFDFSGYSDMAIGLSRLFNVDLPLNFYSPYKATSIIEFWRRWHISLSRFLRDYLYIPLGGSRAGPARRYVNLMVTMVLGGLWHGAAWTFVLWGALHGAYLLINHAWRMTQKRLQLPALPALIGWVVTFLFVMVAWVFFRAPDIATAGRILSAMTGQTGAEQKATIVDLWNAWGYIAGALVVALFLPNSQQVFHLPFTPRGSTLKETRPLIQPYNRIARLFGWRPSLIWAVGAAALLVASVTLFQKPSTFIYFQF